MTANKEDLRRWLKTAKDRGATHLVVTCDTYDWDDYPVYVLPDQNVREVVADYSNRNMQRVMEVYDLSKDIQAQLNETRANHM